MWPPSTTSATATYRLGDQPPCRGAEEGADKGASKGCPQQVDGAPAQEAWPYFVQSQQAKAQHGKRVRGTIIETAFSRQAEAKAAEMLAGIGMNRRGEDWAGRCQDGPQQHCRAQDRSRSHTPTSVTRVTMAAIDTMASLRGKRQRMSHSGMPSCSPTENSEISSALSAILAWIPAFRRDLGARRRRHLAPAASPATSKSSRWTGAVA